MDTLTCQICSKQHKNKLELSRHFQFFHLDINKKEYYDKFLRKENEGICPICKKDAKFISLGQGYEKYCLNDKFTDTIACKICGEVTKYRSNTGFSRRHLLFHNIEMREYYDKYLKKENEGKCLNCGKETSFINGEKGYSNYCFGGCGPRHEAIKEKTAQTNLSRYGGRTPMETETGKNNYRKNCLEKYGVDWNWKVKDLFQKSSDTMLEKYGKPFYTMTEEFQEKRKETCNEKYGADHYARSAKFKLKHYTEDDKKRYYKEVLNETNKWRKQLFESWNGLCYYYNVKLKTDKKDFNDPLYATIDHFISIKFGYMNKINPKIIGNINNLRIASKQFNSEKEDKGIDEFIHYRAKKLLEGLEGLNNEDKN